MNQPLTKEDVLRIIREDNILGASEAFKLVSQGGIQAKPGSYGTKYQAPTPYSPLNTFADPRRRQPLQFGLMGMPYRSGATYLRR
jgi:hypothetical protein